MSAIPFAFLERWWLLPDATSGFVFFVGWTAGWIGFLRAKRLRQVRDAGSVNEVAASIHDSPVRTAVSVIVPCRNEAANLAELLPTLHSALRAYDEIIVVDDDSDDDTVTVASNLGATVVRVGSLPPGWVGKSNACWRGVQSAQHEVLLFVDADVRVGAGAVDDIVNVLSEHPEAVVSAMPWHRTKGWVERFSMLFNVISAMVASVGNRGKRRVAYGPFLAVRRETYLQAGGHAHPSVRGAVVEDLALARVMPSAVATVASRSQVEYRMYPLGARQLLEGWTKNTAIGAANVPRWSAALNIVWIVSLCGGPLTSVWCYVLSAAQVSVIARRFGNFGVFSALAYPLHAAVFVVVAVRSAVRSALFGHVAWRGRTIATR
jgi:4,4'-diaponeurosporenoate glycosyltransferase